MTRKAQSTPQAVAQKAAIIAQNLKMGQSFRGNGQLKLAEASYRKVLSLDPNHSEALHMLGVVALQLGAFDDAVRLIKRAAKKNPNDPSIFVNLGSALHGAKQNKDSRAAFETALKMKPNSIEAYHNLGKLLTDMQQYDGAIKAYEACLALNPRDLDSLVGIGIVHKYSGDSRRAEGFFEEVIRLSQGTSSITPLVAKAYANLALAYVDQARHADAFALVNKAIALDPHLGELRFSRSLISLRLGRFDIGWPDYEGRYTDPNQSIPRFLPPPVYWTGQDLSDKTLLLWTEQGPGDEILYGSMMPDITAHARRCILECSPRMVPVFARSFPQLEVLAYKGPGERATPANKIDTQISVASLGKYLRPTMDSIPKRQGFLKADEARAAVFRNRYRSLVPGNIVVGISWRSTDQAQGGAFKSSELGAWRDVLTVPGITFVNLQYGKCEADLATVKQAFGVDVFNDPTVDPLKNMDDFFAQVAAMDMVVTTSNTTVHVAGSLNVPALLLLNEGSPALLWYWFLERADSPWYPSVRIFRSRREENADEADNAWWRRGVAEIAQALMLEVQHAAKGVP